MDNSLQGPVVVTQEAISIKKISFKMLLGIYFIIPICICAYLIDSFFMHDYLRNNLPITPESYFILALIFGTPHIIASNLIFISNKEYIKAYWLNVLVATFIIITFFYLGSQGLSYNMLFFIVATATIIHVIKQQAGIGNLVSRLSGPVYKLWVWSIIGASLVIYNCVFLQHVLSVGDVRLLNYTLIPFTIIIISTAFLNHFRVTTTVGRQFLWANTSMVLLSIFFYIQKYYFFAILGPRFIHDLTAFVFYITHDYNRHHITPQNGMYRIFNKLKISSLIAVPLTAIFITIFLREYADQYFGKLVHLLFNKNFPGVISVGFVIYLGLMHYYMESFTWKGVSPYRKYIAFSQ